MDMENILLYFFINICLSVNNKWFRNKFIQEYKEQFGDIAIETIIQVSEKYSRYGNIIEKNIAALDFSFSKANKEFRYDVLNEFRKKRF